MLTEEDVLKMREEKRYMSFSEIARKYNVALTTAYKAIKGMTWNHVK